MTDPTREVDIDSFFGFGAIEASASTALDRDQTHYVGDSCPPDGHRSSAVFVPPDHAAAEDAVLAAVMPLASAPPAPPSAAPGTATATWEHLAALVFTSRSGGMPHVVTIHHNDQDQPSNVSCPCKAGTFNPRGCWAMNAARTVLDLPLP